MKPDATQSTTATMQYIKQRRRHWLWCRGHQGNATDGGVHWNEPGNHCRRFAIRFCLLCDTICSCGKFRIVWICLVVIVHHQEKRENPSPNGTFSTLCMKRTEAGTWAVQENGSSSDPNCLTCNDRNRNETMSHFCVSYVMTEIDVRQCLNSVSHM